ncbi:hypothetical protein [Streptomyces otsuchiensis]|uniref:hypothetical protein n=1 Tax=Streptomyces otsuchiensis TaxID=2681388 RepID=UPI0010303FCF|nr:hypothetical protein [Streptomyces otsuchiensis]
MIRITRTRTLTDLTARAHRVPDLEEALEEARDHLSYYRAQQAEDIELITSLQNSFQALDQTHTETRLQLRRAEEQVLLDHEDRVVLRTLLRAARRQEERDRDAVYLLYRRGELHSVHRSREGAETAAEKDGAVPGGWAPCPPGSKPPSDSSPTGWRIEPVRLAATDC